MAKERISIENSRGEQLPGRLFVPQQSDGRAVLFVHGFGSRGRTNEQYAKQAVQQGVIGLSFDLGGHGDSTEDAHELSVNDHLNDVRQAYDFLAVTDGVDKARIGVAGMSFGGYIATLLSAERLVKSLLLRSPPLYPDHLRPQPRQNYSEEEALRTKPVPNNSALDALRRFTGRVLLVTSEFDTVVPPYITEAYEDAAPDAKSSVLPGAQHYLDASAQQFFKPLVLEWALAL